MRIEVIAYPLFLAVPGIVWFVINFRKYQDTEAKKSSRWQLFKLIISIVIMIVVAGLASFLVFGSMLGHGAQTADVLKLFASAILMYVATIFLLGQWILSTRLGNVSASITFASGVIYLFVINPVLFVKPLAEKNIATAQYLLGYFYEAGIGGVPKNKRNAGDWYSKAGKQGYISAARAYVNLFPSSRDAELLKILVADEPDGEIYFYLYESIFIMPYSSEIEREIDRVKWLFLAAEYGHRDSILRAMDKKYPLERSCRLSPKAYEALPQYKKWLSAYEKTRGKPNFKEYLLQELKDKVTCLAEKVAEAKIQDAQLAKLTEDLLFAEFQSKINALATIKKMGPRAKAAIPNLLKLAHTRNSSIAWHALIVIKKIDPDGAIVKERIVAMLNHPSPHIRVNGAYGVALYADVLPGAIKQLDILLDDQNNEVAGRAALALSEYGGFAKSSLEKIKALKKRRDGRLISYARQAYNKIKYPAKIR